MFGTIVVGTESSPAALAAVTLAIDLAKAGGSQIVFVNVVDVGKLVPLSGYDTGFPEEAVDLMLDESRTFLATAKAQAEASGVTATCCTTQGDAADEILDVAMQRNAGLIVMGTHNRTGIARLFVGSVAAAVLAGAHCPVMVTRANAAKS